MNKSEAIAILRRYIPPPLLVQILEAFECEEQSQSTYDAIDQVEGYRRAVEQGMHFDPAESTDHPLV